VRRELLYVTILDAIRKRDTGEDLLAQPSDEELLAWAEELQSTKRPKRKRPLVAAPID
jgi:hypothetical protein